MNRRWILILLFLFVALSILMMTYIALYLFAKETKPPSTAAIITEIEAPTATEIIRATFEPTSTPSPTLSPQDLLKIHVGGYAQISGTAGDGLSIRSGPATTFAINFVGLDSELFKVIDGPVEADGYTWWKVEAPYDASRNGWCVQNYLNLITSPQE
ncbi:MAG: hypothetical protein BGO78_01150 [Chloroflexi bacterium 44-23]|nr:MAG: hypothetical protein BGO78_01150 [Chloroflexi bacterium 44-23]